MIRRHAPAVASAAGLLALCVLAPAPALAEDQETSRAGAVVLPGEEVEQSSDRGAPTPLTAGAWRGTLGAVESGEDVRYFEYTRVTDDSTLLVSVMSPGADPARQDGVELEVTSPDGDACNASSASDSRGDDDPTVLATELAVGVQEVILTDDERTLGGFACLNENRLVIAVSRGSNGEAGEAPYSLRIVEESMLASAEDLPAAVEVPEPELPEVDGEPEDLPGAPGPLDAPEIGAGAYRGSITTDRTVLYRVPDVGWGQTLRAALFVPPADLDPDTFGGPDVAVRILTPMGTTEGTSSSSGVDLDAEDSVQTAASAGPVRYLNRRSDVVDAPPYVPGDYYVMITVDPPESGPAVDVDYTLQVDVTGETDDAPDFATEAYLVAEGAEEPVVTAVTAPGILGVIGTVVRLGVAVLLAVAGLVACVAGVRVLRT